MILPINKFYIEWVVNNTLPYQIISEYARMFTSDKSSQAEIDIDFIIYIRNVFANNYSEHWHSAEKILAAQYPNLKDIINFV